MKKSINEKSLDFVVKNYKPDSFDTPKAIAKFNARYNLNKKDIRLHPAIWAVAASLIIGVFILTHFTIKPQSEWVTIAATNETINYFLPDSSAITIYKNSSIRFDAKAYGEDTRQINMSGKAYFDVRKSKTAPFEVYGEVAKVRVLGTEFQISESEQSTEVYVNSGRVLFTAINSENGVTLTKGMFAELTLDNQAPQITEETTMNPLAWVNGVLIYKNAPISDVLAELSAFYEVKLHTQNIEKRLNATFNTDSLDETVKMIEQVMNIKIIRTK